MRLLWVHAHRRAFLSSGAANPSQESFQDQIEHSQQEDDNGDLVDAVHHPDIDVQRTGRIFFAKEVAADLAEGKKLLPPPLSS